MEGFTEAITKEILPEWNIKAIVVQPGAFQTEWGRSSLERIPPHPLYAHPTSPTQLFRQMADAHTPLGDPVKAGKTIMEIASIPNPPVRVQIGTESIMFIRKKAQKTIDDTYEFEELGHSTNADGIDKDQLIANLTEVKV